MGEVSIITPAAGSTPGRVTAPTQDALLQGVELGDAMFDRLSAKLDGLAALRVGGGTGQLPSCYPAGSDGGWAFASKAILVGFQGACSNALPNARW